MLFNRKENKRKISYKEDSDVGMERQRVTQAHTSTDILVVNNLRKVTLVVLTSFELIQCIVYTVLRKILSGII